MTEVHPQQKIIIPPKGLKGTRGKCEHAEMEGEHLTIKPFVDGRMVTCRCMICGHFWYRSALNPTEVQERRKERSREYMRKLYWERQGTSLEELPPIPKGKHTSHKVKLLLPPDEKKYQELLAAGADKQTIKKFRQAALRRLRNSSSESSQSSNDDV